MSVHASSVFICLNLYNRQVYTYMNTGVMETKNTTCWTLVQSTCMRIELTTVLMLSIQTFYNLRTRLIQHICTFKYIPNFFFLIYDILDILRNITPKIIYVH